MSPDGRWLAVSNGANPDNGTPAYVMVWDLREAQPSPRRIDLGGDIPQVGFTSDNRLVVAGDGEVPNSGVFVVDPATGQVLSTIPDAHLPMAVDPTGPRIVTRTDDLVSVRNLETGAIEHSLPSSSSIELVAFAPDGRSVATGWQDRSITVWDPASGRLLEHLAGHTSPPATLQYVGGSSTLYSAASDGAVIVWDLAGDRRVVSQIAASGSGPQQPVVYVAPSPDGTSIAYIYEPDPGGDLGFFDLETGERSALVDAKHGRVGWQEWTPDGRSLVTVGIDDTMARLWDPASGTMVAEQALPFDSTSGSIGWRPGGTSVFAGLHEGGVVELDAKTLEIIGKPMRFDTYVNNVDLSPDGSTLAVALFDGEGDPQNTVLLLDAETKKVRATLEGVDASWKLFFSPDGSSLAAGGSNGLITLIDPVAGAPIGRPMQGVDGPVSSATYSPDGTLLVAGSSDGTVELWEVATRARVARVTPGVPNQTTYVWFGAAGEEVGVASEDGGVWTFPSSPDEWAARACTIAGRNLGRDEWGELMGDRPYRRTCPDQPEPD
jgi:WD40 repeat protein